MTCKEIKGFNSLIQWQIVEFARTTLYGNLFIHLPSATFNHSFRERYFRYAIYVEAVKITFVFLYLNTFCTFLTYIQRILTARHSTALSTFQYKIARFLSFCFVKTKQFLYRWFYVTKKRDWWAWQCCYWLENIFNVQTYHDYLGEPARQLATSSPNKIRPFKQRFLRKTSNLAFFKSRNSFKYSSFVIELMCIHVCRNNTNNL